MKFVRLTPEMVPLAPVAISTPPASSLVTIKGMVTEIYGPAEDGGISWRNTKL